MTPELARKYDALRTHIQRFDRVLVAFSGGVDSSLVAFVAAEVLGPNAMAVTSGSKSLKRSDLSLTLDLAERWNMQHRVIVTDELTNTDYRKNPVNRCFYCKTSLYDSLKTIADDEGFDAILNGTNIDDLGDHRPGLIAAADFSIVSPLADAGFTKADIRALANHLGMENADKPQAACLSSRFPYGSHIDEERLAQVEAAEDTLAELGFRQFRVRHHEEVARLEIDVSELERAFEQRDVIQDRIREVGYRYVALDLGGFRSGSLNEGLINVVQIHEPS